MAHSNLVPALLVPLFLWRLYRRVRRNIGRQRVHRGRLIAYTVLFGVFLLVLGAISLPDLRALSWLGGGALAGLVLGGVALHYTRHERVGEGQFYTPNPYIGIAVSLLLVGRVAFRASVLLTAEAPAAPSHQFLLSPLTLGLFGVLAGYYITYYCGIVLRSRREQALALGDQSPGFLA